MDYSEIPDPNSMERPHSKWSKLHHPRLLATEVRRTVGTPLSFTGQLLGFKHNNMAGMPIHMADTMLPLMERSTQKPSSKAAAKAIPVQDSNRKVLRFSFSN